MSLVHTVAKTYCPPVFAHCILTLIVLHPLFSALPHNCLVRLHYNVCTGSIVGVSEDELLVYLLLNFCLSQLYYSSSLCCIVYSKSSPASADIEWGGEPRSADTAVQPPLCKFYFLYLFLESLASLREVCGTCPDANGNTIGPSILVSYCPRLPLFLRRFHKNKRLCAFQRFL